MKKLVSLLLSAVLLLSALPAQAAEKSFPDLPTSYWAYADLTRCVDGGILTGREDGTLAPDATLSWGEYLTMLARAFYPELLAPTKSDPHWASPAYNAAKQIGVLKSADFLSVGNSAASLNAALDRQSTAVLMDRVLREVLYMDPATVVGGAMAIPDFNSIPETYRSSVLQCYARGIITGYMDGSFGGSDSLTRAAGAVILLRGTDILLGGWEDDSVDEWSNPDDWGINVTPPDTYTPEGALTDRGCNDAKLIRLYGTAGQKRYPSQTEAEKHMAAVIIPMWRIDSNGNKYSTTGSFLIHEAMATEVVQIFTEIFNDPEQFPIKDIGGYGWRGDSAKGEHNCGTAVDINPNENYQIYPSGKVGAGSFWKPGENPYSIKPDGSVVRIFHAHGWTWGGADWPASSNKDYMHFSYLGV